MVTKPDSDLILVGGSIATMDADDRFVPALAVRGDRILLLGDNDQVRCTAGDGTKVVDLDGRTVIPGIIDSHCHPESYGVRLQSWVNVEPARVPNREQLLNRIASAAEARGPDDWVICFRFDDNKSGGYPTLEEMDAAGRGRPVFISGRIVISD